VATSVVPVAGDFELTTQAEEIVCSKHVVVAAGITHFSFMPPMLGALPQEFVTHSSDHKAVSRFEGRRVTVIGAEASAIDPADPSA
jgi:cation diffusion facilitator CzcD-associated flavoprotein CzcO